MKNFDEIYKTLSNIPTDEFDKAKKELTKRLLIGIPLAIFFVLFGTYLLPGFIFFFFVIALIVLLIYVSNSTKNASVFYKNEVISKLVSEYDENLSFDPQSQMSKIDYMQAEFEHFDHFYANDFIYGKIDGIMDFKFGDVCTEDVDTDSDGHETRTTVFRGLFSIGSLNQSINSTIKIQLDISFFKGSKKNLLSMDSQEFEKHFDVYCTDKIIAMRILTSDIMDYMIKFKNENKIKFEMTIKNSQIFTRIHCQDMFELPSLGKALDYETLYKYYKYLNFMCELNKKIYDTISSKDI